MQLADTCEDITYSDPNITAYVLENLGPRCLNEIIVASTLFIYPLILIIGLVGNVCTCLVITLNANMRTPTNYYLFSLAVSDLLMLILGLPVELYGVVTPQYPYQFGEFICKSRAFLIEFTSYASILTLTSFSLERWMAICFPLKAKRFSTLDRAIKMIVGVWLAAFLAAFPVFFIVTINRVNLPPPDQMARQDNWFGNVTINDLTIRHTEFCALDVTNVEAQRAFLLSAFSIFFLLPAIVITVVYMHILYKIHQSDRCLVAEQQNKIRNRKSLIRMLATVVVIFFVCWIPFHVQRLITILFPNSASNDGILARIGMFLFYVSGYFYYSNSALNPIVYNIISTKYRRAFIKTILYWKCSDNFYTKVNLSTYPKNRQSLSRQSANTKTRSMSKAEIESRKKSSVDSSFSNQRSIRSVDGRKLT